MAKKGFKEGNARLDRMLQRPGVAERVAQIQEASSHAERVHAMNLAMIRKAAELTQTDLAERLGVNQSVISKTERQDDMLLSTLMEYLTAAGAEEAKVVVKVRGQEVELDMKTLQQK
jgi:DNA-binding XRE family transcriptional regulator